VVRSSDTAAQRLAKQIRDSADGAAGGPLGDPPALERSALFQVLTREPPRPRGAIPVHPTTDGAAILARVLSEPIAEEDAAGTGRAEAAAARGPASKAWRTYEREGKRRWHAARRAAGLPAPTTAAAEAWRGESEL
jgi:hypothetical protein